MESKDSKVKATFKYDKSLIQNAIDKYNVDPKALENFIAKSKTKKARVYEALDSFWKINKRPPTPAELSEKTGLDREEIVNYSRKLFLSGFVTKLGKNCYMPIKPYIEIIEIRDIKCD